VIGCCSRGPVAQDTAIGRYDGVSTWILTALCRQFASSMGTSCQFVFSVGTSGQFASFVCMSCQFVFSVGTSGQFASFVCMSGSGQFASSVGTSCQFVFSVGTSGQFASAEGVTLTRMWEGLFRVKTDCDVSQRVRVTTGRARD
jgi:hypothetical protein